jgi:glutamate-1-semialdehyde 2,1-aminomutase
METVETGRLTLEEEYVARNPKSRELFERAKESIAGGFTHYARQFMPFPLYIERCAGSRKWDVDGHQYVDFWMGHGALLLGHGHPLVLEAISQQLPKGTHLGGESPLAIEWAELIRSMVPSAQLVRFTQTGGEATLLSMRVARAFTGRDKIVKFMGNFHGWHDQATLGVVPPYEVPFSPGVPASLQASIVLCPFNDVESFRQTVEARDDIAGVIMEPGGAFDDAIPSSPEFLREVRRITKERGIILIFDEVVTGFRYAKGGVQEYFGVTPDLTALGKIVSGGLPGGALVGRADVMEVLAFKGDPQWDRYRMVPLPGTYNANPLTAAAGVATLRIVATGEPTARAIATASTLRDRMNEVLARRGIPGLVYGRASFLHIWLGQEPPRLARLDFSNAAEDTVRMGMGTDPRINRALRIAMLIGGVDLMRVAGHVMAAHTDDDLQLTVDAFDRALERIQKEGII